MKTIRMKKSAETIKIENKDNAVWLSIGGKRYNIHVLETTTFITSLDDDRIEFTHFAKECDVRDLRKNKKED